MQRRELLTQIDAEIVQAEQHAVLIRQKMSELEQAGMYPAVPTERWKDDRYLYLYFAHPPNGLHLDAKQRLYVGADPARIEEARRLVKNRRVWEELLQLARWLDQWIMEKETGIRNMASQAGRWPRAKEEWLGTDIAHLVGEKSPNH